nr:hva22-like protein a [Quercus suber]
MDSWDAIIAREASGTRDETVETLEQCEMVTTLQADGTNMEKATEDLSKSQGDPLSPYLFILGSEVLLRLLNREVSQKRLSGVKVSNTAPPISKLCYADDIILFCKAKSVEIAILKSCLEKFCSWSGQLISVEKSGCFPSKGMSLLGILNFALKSLDVLTLCCASIRAIENNSSSDTQKLVTYWIAFSLISLFENAFLMLLERLWFWPHMKLMIICWLVVPHFDGASYVYNHLVRPCLSINPLVVIDEFNRWKEFLLKRDHFLSEAERYINENGPEALEELIASKIKSKKPNQDMDKIEAIAVMEKKEVESNCKEPNIEQKGNRVVEVTEKKEVPAAKCVVSAEPNSDQTENKISASKEIKGPAEAVAAARELPDSPIPKEVQKEWTCDICQLTTQSEKILNSHLQGKKHKAAYEAFIAKNQPNMVPASTAKKTEQPVEELEKIISTNGVQITTVNHEEKQKCQPKSVLASTAKKSDQLTKEEPERVSNSGPEQKKEVVSVKESTFRCNICNISCTGENNLISHFNGRKHLAQIRLLSEQFFGGGHV